MNLPDGLEAGTPVKLINEAGTFLAQGYFSSYSQIAVRIWSYQEEESIDIDFFKRRIERALALRRSYLNPETTDAYRLVYSENDFLPGLIVDRYADYLVLQCHTKGIERWKPEIIRALTEALQPKGIYERSDALARRADSLEKQTGLLSGDMPELITIRENGLKFLVDVKGGQKTGFFLDQRDKRQALMKFVAGKPVLNCFSYTGGFSVYALAGGASQVTSVDVSESAIALAKENMKLNGLPLAKCEFICDDVKKYLRELEPEKFKVIVLDPPAFIKDRHKKKEGLRGYRSINEAALRLLPDQGILLSCSCSAHFTYEEFRYLLSEAGGRSHASLQILESFTHGLDHPELVPLTESEYLKCFFLSTNKQLMIP